MDVTDPTPTVGVVVPAYRPDPDRLATYVRELAARIEPATIRIELDDPDPLVEQRLASLPATVHAVSRRRGKGRALTDGFDALDTDVLAFADADGSTTAQSLADVVRAVRQGETDLAVGSRRHPDATVRSHQTLARRYLGDVFAVLARHVLAPMLYDYQCGAKALTATAWNESRVDISEEGFAWDVELVSIVHAHGFRVTEVPVVWEDQPRSTVAASSTSLDLARALVSVRRRNAEIRCRRSAASSLPVWSWFVDRDAPGHDDD